MVVVARRRENPPEITKNPAVIARLTRSILADKPRVTRYTIKWDDTAVDPDLPPEQTEPPEDTILRDDDDDMRDADIADDDMELNDMEEDDVDVTPPSARYVDSGHGPNDMSTVAGPLMMT